MLDSKQTEIRLWNHILMQQYGTTDLASLKNEPQDAEGYAFFRAIDSAFCPMPNIYEVTVKPELIQYLAGWCRDTVKGYYQSGGPIGEKPNHFVRRAFLAFMYTLREAVMCGKFRYYEPDRPMYGCFTLPQWFIDECISDAHEEALLWNEMYVEDPDHVHFND